MASVQSEGDQEALSLNLMPMLDIFSILVTFLLMSYSTDPVNHDIDTNLELPDSKTLLSLDEVPAVVVSRQEIFINDKPILRLVNGEIPKGDLTQGAILPVFRELDQLRSMNEKVVLALGEEKKAKPGTLTLEMDKNHNFKLLKRIMLSAQQAEFVSFKFLVEKEVI